MDPQYPFEHCEIFEDPVLDQHRGPDAGGAELGAGLWNRLCIARVAVITLSYPCAYLATHLQMSAPIPAAVLMYLPTVAAALLSLVYLEYLRRTIAYLE